MNYVVTINACVSVKGAVVTVKTEKGAVVTVKKKS